MQQLRTPEGVREVTRNLQELIDETGVLDQLAPACRGCPANALGRPFGCWSYIRFPLGAAVEEALMARLPADLNSVLGSLLQKAIADFNYDGAPVAALRRQGQVFFERNRPVKRKWGGFFSGKTISSDQILQAIFFVGPIAQAHAVLLCLFLGLGPAQLDAATLTTLMTTPAARAELLSTPQASPNPELEQLTEFLTALRTAAALDVRMLIDA